MLKLWIVVLSIITLGSTQTAWLKKAQLKNADEYFLNAIQETVRELEKLEFCNLKMLDFSQTLSEQIYDWLVAGTVKYTNGFVVSIQKIDISDKIDSGCTQETVNNTIFNEATALGTINLRDVEIGFDVVVNLKDEEESHHFTGSYTYLEIQIQASITKNLHLSTMSTSSWLNSMSNGGRKMVYMPANNLTEVLSRKYFPADVWDGVNKWAKDIIAPTLLEVAERMPFPEVCFNNC